MSLADHLAANTPPPPDRKVLGALADLLERNGIDIADVGRVQKVRAWQGFYKDSDGEAHTVDMTGIEFSPAWAEGPQWPTVQAARPIAARPRPMPRTERAERVIVIAPDPQFGYRRYEDGTLEPFHDDRALDLHLQIIRDARPDRIVNLGDTLDLAEFSDKFAITPEMVLTTQPTLDRAHRHIAEQLTEAPDGCTVDLLEGNHDARMGRMITRNVMAALRLRRANAPEEWPVVSVQNLLRIDDFGDTATGEARVRYVDGYPAGRVKLADGAGSITPLYAIHGERLSVSAVAKAERQSFVQGHIHRIADHYESYELDGSLVNVNAWSPGCLCRVDGTVPSTRGGNTATGRPVARSEGWQQGVSIITVMPDGAWTKEIVPFFDGRAIWRGKEYRA